MNGKPRMLAAAAFREDNLVAGFALPGFEGPAGQFRVVFIASRTDGLAGAVVYPPGPDVGGAELRCCEQTYDEKSQYHAGIVAH